MARWVFHRAAIRRIDHPIMDHLDDIGEDVADSARTIVPVDTSNLRSTIRSARHGRLRVRVIAGGQPGAATGEPVDYAHFVERGTSKMAAQPFMRPALFRAR